MATTNLTNSNFWTEMFKTIITAISDTDSVTVKTADGTDSLITAELLRAYLQKGITPTIGTDGYWYIGGVLVKDASGNPLQISAAGQTPTIALKTIGGIKAIYVTYKGASAADTDWTLLVTASDLMFTFDDLTDAQKQSFLTYFTDAITNAETATANANTAATVANTAASNADTATSKANTATKDANDAANKADTATNNTNTATTAANNAATNANNAATRVTNAITDISAEKKAATDAATAANNITQTAITAENARVEAENSRVSAETSRVSAESGRASSESTRQSNENSRVSAETSRSDAESSRVNAEKSRVSSESSRSEAESSRQTAESERQTNETARKANETSRVSAESSRVTAENGRIDAESSRVTTENKRVTAETNRADAESKRVTAENTRSSNESSRVTAETDRQNAESTRESNTSAAISNLNTQTAVQAELNSHPPKISNGLWAFWNTSTGKYDESTYIATGKSPYTSGGTWWIFDDSAQKYVDTGVSVSSQYTLTKDAIESQLTGDITSHNHNTQLSAALASYVQKVSGKDLSTNDFTTALLNKLNGLSNYDDSAAISRIVTLETWKAALTETSADSIINTFNEIESFLQGITGADTLATMLSSMRSDILSVVSSNYLVKGTTTDGIGEGSSNLYFTSTRAINALVDTLASYSKTGHTHTVSNITDFPSSMPASDVPSWAKQSSKPSYSQSEIANNDNTVKDASYMQTGVNSVTTLASLPVSKAMVYATLSAATDISLASALAVGQCLTIIIMPSADITQPLPTTNGFTSLDGDSLSLASGKMAEISIACYATGTYLISSKAAS